MPLQHLEAALQSSHPASPKPRPRNVWPAAANCIKAGVDALAIRSVVARVEMVGVQAPSTDDLADLRPANVAGRPRRPLLEASRPVCAPRGGITQAGHAAVVAVGRVLPVLAKVLPELAGADPSVPAS